MQGADSVANTDRTRQRHIVDAFLAASRGGNFEALLAVLDPDVIFRADPTAVTMGASAEVRGATAVAGTFSGRAQAAQPALIDGTLGLAVAIDGQLRVVLNLTIAGGKITGIEAIADHERIRALDLELLDS